MDLIAFSAYIPLSSVVLKDFSIIFSCAAFFLPPSDFLCLALLLACSRCFIHSHALFCSLPPLSLCVSSSLCISRSLSDPHSFACALFPTACPFQAHSGRNSSKMKPNANIQILNRFTRGYNSKLKHSIDQQTMARQTAKCAQIN